MAEVILKNIKKVYPHQEPKKKKKGEAEKKTNLQITDEGVLAVDNFNLEIKDKEFIVLVGPSGCGKSTTLRMVAGLEEISGGELYIGGQLMNDVAPKDRDIAMVFQNYALYPHMTVRENIAFPLKLRKVDKAEIDQRVNQAAEILGITEYLDRKPKALSGGQRQRVAIGRAIVREPKVLLMDEPLSNLDAKLRVEMRTVIKEIQKQVGITTVYVTHDQEEAMAISDRIAVLSAGTIHHCGEPKNIYQRPADLFVATFIGKSNLLSAKLVAEDGKGVLTFQNGYSVVIPDVRPDEIRDRGVTLSVRPEEMHVSPCQDKSSQPGLHGTIRDSVFLGSNTHYFVDLETGEPVEIIQESEIDSILPPGSKVVLTLKEKKVNLFDPESTKSIMSGIRNSAVPAEEG